MRHLLSATLTVLLTASSASSQLSALTNADILRLATAGLPDQALITMINEAKANNAAKFDLGPLALSELTARKVSQAVIAALSQPAEKPSSLAETSPALATQAKRTGPNGAIARCANGALVLVATGANTCKDLGGVAEWYEPTVARVLAEPRPVRFDNTLDRRKFDKVYAAGKAVDNASLSEIASPRLWVRSASAANAQFAQLMLTFDLEISIARDKATTDAEKALVGHFQGAHIFFNLYEVQSHLGHPSAFDVLKQASARLDSANMSYLGK